MQFTENVQANWQEGFCFIKTMPDAIQPEQSIQERIQELQWELVEHLPYSSDLIPRDLHLFGPLKTTLVASISLMMKKRKWRCRSG
jgi:hypothetical protein